MLCELAIRDGGGLLTGLCFCGCDIQGGFGIVEGSGWS